VADPVELAFRKAAARLLPEGSPVLAAVSGGGDSVALLYLLNRLGASRPFDLTIAHLDHATRRGSAADRRFVERLAGKMSLRCISDRRSVPDLRRKSESPEEAARRIRRAFLLEAAREAGAEWIATGHNLDDQAETVLMRLLRGAGPTALAGIAETGPGPFVRPLLGIERADLRAFLDRHEISFREDPTNRSLRFDRNRIRHLVLPLVTETFNPRAARHLVHAATLLQEDGSYLDELAARRFRRLRDPDTRAGIRLDARKLASTPPVMARRIARLALQRAGVTPGRITARHITALLDLARGGSGRSLDLPCNVRATRRGQYMKIGVKS
jgi:tRNA(Ile)-lysidine synthase